MGKLSALPKTAIANGTNGHDPASVTTRTVAIVGHAPSTRGMAPYDQGGVEIWTMNDAFPWIQRADRWFELHRPEVYLHPARRTQGYLDWLSKFRGPVYMTDPHPSVPNAVKFQMEPLVVRYGNVFGSTFSWMVAVAAEEGFERIELYGCDLASQTEYEEQRESAAWWIGYCRGRGIDFYLPPGCPLLTRPPYGTNPQTGFVTKDFLDNAFAELRKGQADSAARLNLFAGRIEEFARWRSLMEGKLQIPGVQLPTRPG